MKTPWVYRHCPKRWLRTLDWISIVIGGIGAWIYMIGGFAAIYVAPVHLSLKNPSAMLSKPVVWLATNTDKDSFIVIYSCILLPIAFVLLYGIHLFDYIRMRRAFPDADTMEPIVDKMTEQDAPSNGDKRPV